MCLPNLAPGKGGVLKLGSFGSQGPAVRTSYTVEGPISVVSQRYS